MSSLSSLKAVCNGLSLLVRPKGLGGIDVGRRIFQLIFNLQMVLWRGQLIPWRYLLVWSLDHLTRRVLIVWRLRRQTSAILTLSSILSEEHLVWLMLRSCTWGVWQRRQQIVSTSRQSKRVPVVLWRILPLESQWTYITLRLQSTFKAVDVWWNLMDRFS